MRTSARPGLLCTEGTPSPESNPGLDPLLGASGSCSSLFLPRPRPPGTERGWKMDVLLATPSSPRPLHPFPPRAAGGQADGWARGC